MINREHELPLVRQAEPLPQQPLLAPRCFMWVAHTRRLSVGATGR